RERDVPSPHRLGRRGPLDAGGRSARPRHRRDPVAFAPLHTSDERPTTPPPPRTRTTMLEHFHAKKRDVTAAIADVATLATRVGARSLAGRVDADLVQKLQGDRFHLVVVGEFNHGKTTF